MEKIIVIGGGVGPMAGVALHAKIVENTLTDGRDQTHLNVLHFSRSPDVPDRTGYLLGEEKTNPAEGMARTFAAAWASLRELGQEGVGGIPCNTFHAPEIFRPFLGILAETGVGIPVVHMLEETVRLLDEIRPEARRIGVLSTTGTRKTGVYRRLLEHGGREVLEVPESRQKDVQEAIYDRGWGIKAVSPVTPRARQLMLDLAGILAAAGAETVILGCTEIPLALPEKTLNGIPLLDPVTALARALIREASPRKLKAL